MGDVLGACIPGLCIGGGVNPDGRDIAGGGVSDGCIEGAGVGAGVAVGPPGDQPARQPRPCPLGLGPAEFDRDAVVHVYVELH